jgi:hypothetical protein
VRSTATQKLAEGHDTASMPLEPLPSTCSTSPQVVPFQLRASPTPSTAMQNVELGHETLVTYPPEASTHWGVDVCQAPLV